MEAPNGRSETPSAEAEQWTHRSQEGKLWAAAENQSRVRRRG